MTRPVTLCTGQWADLPVAELARKCNEMGFDGLELACWGDHFEVDKAMSQSDYCAKKRELLAKNNMQVFAISGHLVGQAVLDIIDERHKSILPPYVWGNGNPAEVNARADRGIEEHGPGRPEAGREGGQRLHGFEHLAPAVLVSADPAEGDRRRFQAAGRAVQPDPRRIRRVRREVRLGSASDRDRLRHLHGPTGVGSVELPQGVRLQLRPEPPAVAGRSIRWSSSASSATAFTTST